MATTPGTTSTTAPPAGARRADRRAVGVLTVGHLANDVHQGVVPALLPFLVAERGLSYAAAGGLVTAATVLSSAVQPGFGWLADRRPSPWLVPGGLATAATGIALVGVAPTYPLVLLAVLVSGFGVAAFHPEAARITDHVGGDRRASAMSVFAVGGNAGYALGPVLATPLLVAFGVPGTVLLLVPAGLVALVLVAERGRLRAPVATADGPGRPVGSDGRPRWGAFAVLTGVVVLRSVTFFGLVTLVPLQLVATLDVAPATANAGLTLLLLAGLVGTLSGGWVADRRGARPVLVVGLAVTGVLVAVLVAATGGGVASGPVLVAGVLAAVGIGVYAPFGVFVSLGQAYLWPRVGTASGVTIGLSMTIGGLAAPLLGGIGDRHGLSTALLVVAVVPVVGAVLAATLPRPPERAHTGT